MPLRAAAVKAGAKRAAKRRGSKSKSPKSAPNPVAKRRGKVSSIAGLAAGAGSSSLKIGSLKHKIEQGKAAQLKHKAPKGERREIVKSPSKSKRVYTDSKDPRITYSGPRPGKTRRPKKRGK